MRLSPSCPDTTVLTLSARRLREFVFVLMFLALLSAPAPAQLSVSVDSMRQEAEADDELLNLSLRIHPPIIETDEDTPMKYGRRMGYPPEAGPGFVDEGGTPGRCAPSLSQGNAEMSAGGGPLTVRVTTAPGCTWQATGGIAWLIVTDGQSGNGSGTVNCVVSPNPGPYERIGAITIGGRLFTVTQKGGTAGVKVRNYSRINQYN